MKRRVGGVCLVLLMGVLFVHAEMRTWTSIKGDTIEAEYVQMFGGNKVVLETIDGKTLKIPIDGLCAEDGEYLASMVPPKIDIKVDVDKDRNKEFATSGYKRYRETIKCSVSVNKTSKMQCSREFTAYLYVFAQQINGDIHWLISNATQSLSFREDGGINSFKSQPASVEWQDMVYADNRGFKYKGYIVVVEDDAGNAVSIRPPITAFW